MRLFDAEPIRKNGFICQITYGKSNKKTMKRLYKITIDLYNILLYNINTFKILCKFRKVIDMVDVKVTGGFLPEEEIEKYIASAKSRYPDKELNAVEFEVDGDYVNASYRFGTEPFQRIRRITGYLVGTLDRFNNAKRAEEADRVKHELVQ